MKNITLDQFVSVQNKLSGECCDATVEWLSDKGYYPHTYSSPAGEIFNYGNTDLEVFHLDNNQNALTKEIIDSCIKVAKEYVEETTRKDGLYSLSGCTTLRFNKYAVDTEMRPHADHIHDIFQGNERGIPILSLVGLLNDDFEGGEFCFYDEAIDLKKGDLLLFPSIFLYPHHVKKVTKGVRHSFVMWFF